ncbi:MAG: hypothetical protein HOO06_14460 [Bdellovibrionaceae bacterium]|jgi:hypothetical protein|nr:hypothetical protein [Pseudobdellovibrionaceae bacterium]
MKKIFIIITMFFTSVTSLAENTELEVSEEKLEKRLKVKQLCGFLVSHELVKKAHPCQLAISEESLIDELLDRGILDEIENVTSSICIGGGEEN